MYRHDDDMIFAGDYSHIPAGTYEAMVTSWERGEFFKRRKLYLWFQIVTPGEYCGIKIFMSFNFHKTVLRGSKYYEAWVIANKGIKPRANCRMSPHIFKEKVFTVKVRDVASNRRQQKIETTDKYSVVDKLLEICTG